MYQIIISDYALKQLNKLEKESQRRILSALERVRIRPTHYFSRLVGESSYKLKVGDYRVIADIEHEKLIILVIKIGHRRNIYDF